MDKEAKRWLSFVLGAVFVILLTLGAFNAYVDPYFHYHKPIKGINYILEDQRFINDGIVKNFDYNAVIAGSSMTENFKPSELNALFKVSAIKVPFSGGSFREVNELLEAAIKHNSNIKMIVRGLDYNRLFNTVDARDYDEYPEYLYDDKILNDVNYLFNIDATMVALQNVIGKDSSGSINMDFDAYSNWENYYAFGKTAVDAQYARNTVVRAEAQAHVTEEEFAIIDANIDENVIRLAKENPGIEFYYYFTPYSIAYIDFYKLEGKLEKQFEAEKYIIEKLLSYENIHLFSFFLEHDVIENPDLYRDVAHHSEKVNSMILEWMKEGHDLLTKDNYLEYCEEERNYYRNFDYEKYFEDWD